MRLFRRDQLRASLPSLLIAVAVGASLSVAVAWRCVLITGGEAGFEELDDANANMLWQTYVPDRVPTRAASALANSRLGVTWILLADDASSEAGELRYYSCIVGRAGWPLYCLEGERHGSASESMERSHSVGTLRVPGGPFVPRGLVGREVPVRIMPVGFLLNTVLFAIVALALIRVGVLTRNRARLDRNECPRCRYRQVPPYADDPAPCTECGYAYSHRLHDRPAQIPRRWMVPLLLPQVLLLGAWFLGVTNWTTLRYQLRYVEPILTMRSVVLVTIIAAWISFIAHSAYADRPRPIRWSLSFAFGVVIAMTLYVAIFALAALVVG